MCAADVIGQEVVEKKIDSRADQILIEFDLIDHIELFNAEDSSEIRVHAEGSELTPSFELEEKDGHVMLSDHEVPLPDEIHSDDNACIVVPNYTSYRVYIPKDKTVNISFLEGNFYADSFDGALNVKAENGLIKLKNCLGSIHISLNSGSVYIRNIQNTKINAKTNLGVLIDDFLKEQRNEPKKELKFTLGNPDKSVFIRTILANIYLYGSRD